jgi:hypothetical protein
MPREQRLYQELATHLSEGYPELAREAEGAATAVSVYIDWIRDNKDDMVPYAGLGKRNYTWWACNSLLLPWGFDDSNRIIMTEYDRGFTFLKLEEHRNQNLPPLDVAMTAAEWNARLKQALEHVVAFLGDEKIMTVASWIDPMDHYKEEACPESADDAIDPGLMPENSSIDTKVRQREILPGETHEYIGHMLDYQRLARLDLSPIRSFDPKFNMHKMRLEGWAVALEELLMQAGVLDERPRRGREMQYLMNAWHFSLSIPDTKMQSNEIDLREA